MTRSSTHFSTALSRVCGEKVRFPQHTQAESHIPVHGKSLGRKPALQTRAGTPDYPQENPQFKYL
jgi:hypothetical protein